MSRRIEPEARVQLSFRNIPSWTQIRCLQTMPLDVERFVPCQDVKAIDALAPKSTVLDLGTGALALLARRAAAAGARHVYAAGASKMEATGGRFVGHGHQI